MATSSQLQLREYERRSALQDEMLRPAYRRVEHRAHIDKELSRTEVRGFVGQSSQVSEAAA